MSYSAEIEIQASQLKSLNIAYRSGNPQVDDAVYDKLEALLRAVAPDHPVLVEIQDEFEGDTFEEGEFYKEKPLSIQMGSQNKAMKLDELKTYYRAIQQDGPVNMKEADCFHLSHKCDGASCEITFKDGAFSQALTRGNGILGRDITLVIDQIPGLPKQVPVPNMVVRGEIVLTRAGFKAVNKILAEEGQEVLANARSGAVSIIRTLKNLRFAKHLQFVAFDYAVV